MNWTADQRKAIEQRSGDVIVTASAGTGKTAVLAGRFVDLVCDAESPVDACDILVVTFTEMAAEEMRSRIAGNLKKAYNETRNPRLKRQAMMLGASDISTIHSFCKKLITRYFFQLDIDPTFKVISPDEQMLIKQDILSKTIDYGWQLGEGAAMRSLLRQRNIFSTNGFLNNILKINDFLDGVVNRDDWYNKSMAMFEAIGVVDTACGKRQKGAVERRLRGALSKMEFGRGVFGGLSDVKPWVKLDGWYCEVEELYSLFKSDYGGFIEAIFRYEKPRLVMPRDIGQPQKDLIKDVIKSAFEDIGRIRELAVVNPSYMDKVGSSANLQGKVLIELVKKFNSLYAEQKRRSNCLDFGDLEHYALRLLAEFGDDGGVEPSQTALQIRDNYKYVFVDEYQDVNPVQRTIIDLVSKGDNIFVVGDVKQSIYAFRGADPGIFVEKIQSAERGDGERAGLKVDLQHNFRSRERILDFVNSVFRRTMTASFADIDYDERASLKSGKAEVSDGEAVEFHILDKQVGSLGREDEITVTRRQLEAAFVGQRIGQLMASSFEVDDAESGGRRGLRYSDIVILMRSPNSRAADYVQVLESLGIPVSFSGDTSYADATEISDMLCLLKVLDNPQRDIEFAAVLRSPCFVFSDSELLKIRHFSEGEDYDFYTAAIHYGAKGADGKLAEKVEIALSRLESWRRIARRGQIADVIWDIYTKTGLCAFVRGLPAGEQRKDNLLRLHDRAIEFEGFAGSAKAASLTRFVQFIERLMESGADLSLGESALEAGERVRIMSVHKSKGLEFEVVFLAEVGGQFNKTSVNVDCLYDNETTVGLRVVDEGGKVKSPSIAHQMIAEEKLRGQLAEEMRILYVALTRAKSRLIISGQMSKDKCVELVTKGFYFNDRVFPDWCLSQCNSMLQWLVLGLSNYRELGMAVGAGLEGGNGKAYFECLFWEQGDLRALEDIVCNMKRGISNEPEGEKGAVRFDEKVIEKIAANIMSPYKYAGSVTMVAKDSVSNITSSAEAGGEFSGEIFNIGGGGKQGSAEVGTATHLVISQMPLDGARDNGVVCGVVEKLVADGQISKDIAEQVDTNAIAEFFKSECGVLVDGAGVRVLRELPFTFAFGVEEYRKMTGKTSGGKVGDEDNVIVQGIVDMVIENEESVVIIDFKTGLSEGNSEKYGRQLDLYAMAVSTVLNKRVSAKYLYFLSGGKAVKIG